jgi:hypothetical protein
MTARSEQSHADEIRSGDFRAASILALLLGAVAAGGLLYLSGIPLGLIALAFAVTLVLWQALRNPLAALGAVLGVMPLLPLSIMLARFFGPAFMMSEVFKASDRILFLGLLAILVRRGRFRMTTTDYLLLATAILATLRWCFSGTVMPLLNDFDFAIPYFAGRLVNLGVEMERRWAKRAVWLVAFLAVAGMIEVFYIGEMPRTLLYVAVAEGATDGGGLNAAFHAAGFTGLRESATMFGPLQFASLCMVGIILWWVYDRRAASGVAIAAGLVCTVTRSAWLGTAVAIPVLAVLMHQAKRLISYAVVAATLVVVLIPVVGLGDYISAVTRGQDSSAEGHRNSIADGIEYCLDHPLGSGPGNAGTYSYRADANYVFIENSYLTIAAEYGIITALAFMGFLMSGALAASRLGSRLGFAATGIIAGFSTVMMVAPLHDVFSLAAWLWFPVGLAIGQQGWRHSSEL